MQESGNIRVTRVVLSIGPALGPNTRGSPSL